MPSQYTPELPSIPIDPSIPQFFETFYQISDTPDAHDRYVEFFTDNATLIMASTKAVGKEGWFDFFSQVFLLSVFMVSCPFIFYYEL